jgi:hypothetical protein
VIVTKSEVRIYDAITGKLTKVISDVIDQRNKTEITSFCMDDRHRKFYLGDSKGSIMVYNISNGVFIKNVDESKIEEKKIESPRKSKAEEITHIKFSSFGDYRILFSTNWYLLF